MKRHFRTSIIIIIALIMVGGCRNRSGRQAVIPPTGKPFTTEGLIFVGKDIVTEVYTRPDTMGDPWEVEKVKGFDGKMMFDQLLGKVYSGEVTAYDCFNGEPLKPAEVREIEKEVGYNSENIGKLIFTEDWYWDPGATEFIKKIRSVSFGYETKREEGLPPAFTPMFQIRY